MGKFNKKVDNSIVNYGGSKNFKRPNESLSVIADFVLTSMLNGDKYYEKESSLLERVEKIVKQLDDEGKDFLLKAIVFGRKEGYLRSASHVMANLALENIKGNPLTKIALKSAINRPDDATEMVALWNSRNPNKNIPNALRKAIKENLETKWNEYQLRKYRMRNHEVKLVDLVNLTHPNPNKWNEKFKKTNYNVFKKVLNDTLPNIETAQTINAGTSAESEERYESYINLIRERKLGYLGFLKNIDKIMPKNEEDKELIVNYLTDEKLLKKSMVLPERFFKAFIQIFIGNHRKYRNDILAAIEKAFIARSKDVKIVPEDKLGGIVLDTSGSMSGDPIYRGAVLSAMLLAINPNAKVFAFATSVKELDTYGVTPFSFIVKHFNISYGGYNGGNIDIRPKFVIGYGTEIRSALSAILSTPLDYVFVLSDMQIYNTYMFDNESFVSLFNKYKRVHNKDIEKIVFWDLQGYGKGTPLKINNNNIVELTGFSDKMVEFLPTILSGKSLVKIIKEYEV